MAARPACSTQSPPSPFGIVHMSKLIKSGSHLNPPTPDSALDAPLKSPEKPPRRAHPRTWAVQTSFTDVWPTLQRLEQKGVLFEMSFFMVPKAQKRCLRKTIFFFHELESWSELVSH